MKSITLPSRQCASLELSGRRISRDCARSALVPILLPIDVREIASVPHLTRSSAVFLISISTRFLQLTDRRIRTVTAVRCLCACTPERARVCRAPSTFSKPTRPRLVSYVLLCACRRSVVRGCLLVACRLVVDCVRVRLGASGPARDCAPVRRARSHSRDRSRARAERDAYHKGG